MNNGWIKLHRKFMDWEWYDMPEMVCFFIHLLMDANYEDKKWHGIEIKRGSFIMSVVNYGESMGLSHQRTRTILNRLKSTNEITIKSTNKYTLITINNYNLFQINNKQDNNQITNNQQSNNKQSTTTKEYKKERKKEGGSPPFCYKSVDNLWITLKNKIKNREKLHQGEKMICEFIGGYKVIAEMDIKDDYFFKKEFIRIFNEHVKGKMVYE